MWKSLLGCCNCKRQQKIAISDGSLCVQKSPKPSPRIKIGIMGDGDRDQLLESQHLTSDDFSLLDIKAVYQEVDKAFRSEMSQGDEEDDITLIYSLNSDELLTNETRYKSYSRSCSNSSVIEDNHDSNSSGVTLDYTLKFNSDQGPGADYHEVNDGDSNLTIRSDNGNQEENYKHVNYDEECNYTSYIASQKMAELTDSKRISDYKNYDFELKDNIENESPIFIQTQSPVLESDDSVEHGNSNIFISYDSLEDDLTTSQSSNSLSDYHSPISENNQLLFQVDCNERIIESKVETFTHTISTIPNIEFEISPAYDEIKNSDSFTICHRLANEENMVVKNISSTKIRKLDDEIYNFCIPSFIINSNFKLVMEELNSYHATDHKYKTCESDAQINEIEHGISKTENLDIYQQRNDALITETHLETGNSLGPSIVFQSIPDLETIEEEEDKDEYIYKNTDLLIKTSHGNTSGSLPVIYIVDEGIDMYGKNRIKASSLPNSPLCEKQQRFLIGNFKRDLNLMLIRQEKDNQVNKRVTGLFKEALRSCYAK